MKRRKVSLLLALAMLISCLGTMYAGAVDAEPIPVPPAVVLSPQAYDTFSITVAANSGSLADTSFSMNAGETITISVKYAPKDASISIGLLMPDGKLRLLPASDGQFNETILISTRGKYTLAIQNTSSVDVSVSGSVSY